MNQLNRDDLRRRVEEVVVVDKRNARLLFFVISLVMFLAFMAFTWGMALSNPVIQQDISASHSDLLAVMIMMSVGWATTLFFQGMSAFMDFGFMERQYRDRATSRALREEIYEGTTEKAKNQPGEAEQMVKLSDDGELVPIDKADSKTDSRGSVR